MKLKRKIIFIVLLVPVLSLIAHNIIPHEHHLVCAEKEVTKQPEFSLNSIKNCCDHHFPQTHKHAKASCVITTLPPVSNTYIHYFILEQTILVIPAIKVIVLNFTENTLFFTEDTIFKLPVLRAPPSLMV